jgi:hypothetical protein|tara:strand:- start:159 stop:1925 length:1767 start_codon:yes stop_codon:yes gene_type:complete
MTSKIKVDNIQDQCGTNIISKCGSTHTVTAEVYKANTIKDTSNNTYINKCGTTLTIGGCGQTLALAGGTINELGGGGVDWQTTPKTADFTAAAGEGYFIDTTSNTVTVTLPTGVAGESVTILDYVSNANTNEIFFKPQSGEKIEGNTEGQVVSANRQATTLTYSGSAQGWLVSSSGDSGPIVAPTITFNTATGSLGSISGASGRADPNGNLLPVTGTTTFGTLGYSIQSGSLPAGLTLNSTTGAFVGTITQVVGSDVVSNFTVRITVTETGTTSDRSFSITVGSDALYMVATGGTIKTCGDFKTHIFTGPGTLSVSSVGNAAGSDSVEYLVIAGGGGGGTRQHGSGGGSGGFRTYTDLSPASPLNGPAKIPVSVQGYPITVGGGGSGGAVPGNQNGSSGAASTFSSITSTAGGFGASYNATGGPGGSGGGGGGAASGGSPGGSGNTPPVSPPQGQPGGTGSNVSPCGQGGGGGGAGGAGLLGGTPTGAGLGGVGSYIPSSFIKTACAPSYGTAGPVGSTRYFAAGGAGSVATGSSKPGQPIGGGGNTSPGVGGSGQTNTGSGGGSSASDGNPAGAGGSGIVMIRYKYQ